MDRTTQLQKILEVLGVGDLKALELGDLEDKVKTIKSETLENKYILPAYFFWLDGRLADQDLSDESNTTAEITAWCDSLHGAGYGKVAVIDAFKFWRSLQTQTDPLSARRLYLAELDIFDRFPSPSAGPVWALQGSPPAIPENKPCEITDIPGKSPTSSEMPGKKDNTGMQATGTYPVPHLGYKCKRCNMPGHFLPHCPTRMDPEYDTKPDSTYACGICGVYGEHFDTLCPENTNPQSLNQKRLRYAMRGQAGDNDGISNNAEPISQPIAEPAKSAKTKKSSQRKNRWDTAGPKKGAADDVVASVPQESVLPIRTKRKGGTSSLDSGIDYMDEFVHESRRSNFQGSFESSDYSGSHRGPSPPPLGRAAKRQRSEHWGQTSSRGTARDRDLLFDPALSRRSTQRAVEGRLSYWDDEKGSGNVVLSAWNDGNHSPFRKDDFVESWKSAGNAHDVAPSFGWRRAEELGYSKRYEQDGPEFLENLATAIKDGSDHDDDMETVVVDKMDKGKGPETAPRTPGEGDETTSPRGVVSMVNKHGETVRYDFSKMTPEKAADPLAVVKLFKNKKGILSPLRPDLKRPTAMELWDLYDQQETDGKHESVGQTTAGTADTTMLDQQKKNLSGENTGDFEDFVSKTMTEATAAAMDDDVFLFPENKSANGGH